MLKTHKKTRLIALVLLGLIFLNVNFVSAAINQTLKDKLLPFVDIKYDYANGVIDEVIIYNRALSPEEINALYSLSPQGIGETWNCTVKAIDSTGAEGINSKAITMPGYALPNITGITITPSPAYDESELNCSAIYGNPDGNKGNVTLSWYNGSSLFLQTTQYNKFSGETINEPLTWISTNGLVGYWKFSEGNGTLARDISGNENNGTLINGPTWVAGKYGSGLQFDGMNDYVYILDVDILDLGTSNFTIGFWMNPLSWGDGKSRGIVSKKTNDASNGYVIYNDGSQPNKLNIRINNQNNFFSLSDVDIGVWQHWVFVRNGSMGKWYKNGMLDKTGTVSLDSPASTESLQIGHSQTWNGYFNGTIDEVKIYNRSLSADEILALYQNSPQADQEIWNCTINAIDSIGTTGLPNSKTITIGSQSAQNYTPKWVHVTVTYNKATRQKKIYVNGNLTRTETLQGLSDYKINNQTGNLYAGKLYGLPVGNPFNGSIDEILISPKEKSAAEIWQDYLNNIIYGEMPGPNEAKTMVIEGENITEISIAPIVRVRNKEKTCDVTSKVNLPECVQ